LIIDDRRVRIISGHYGSGKTEFAVNYAVRLAEAGFSPVLADIDVINPYFRSRDQFSVLESLGVRVISSSINASAIDVPAISSGIYSVFDDNKFPAVIDVGGNNAGINILKSFSDHFSRPEEYDLFFVLNTNRTATSELRQVEEFITMFENTCGLKVSGLINNTHMLKSTTINDLIAGYELAKQVSDKTAIPLRYNAGLRRLEDYLPEELKADFFPIDLFMREEWMS
jgi:hypothetical protein